MRDANKSRRREREVPFYATRERRRKKKRGERARTRTYNTYARNARMYAFPRVHANVARCSHREETHVRAEGSERAPTRDKDGERKGEARETGRRIVCVPPEECTRLLVL